MKVKRFEAANTKSALALVKEELGMDAVILSTKTLPPEPGRASLVEVVAAVDFDVETVSRQEPRNGGGHHGNGRPVGNTVFPRARPAGQAPSTTATAAAPPPRRGAWRPPREPSRPGASAGAIHQPANPPNPADQADPGYDDKPMVGVNLSREARLLQQRFAGCNHQAVAAGRQNSNTVSVFPTPPGQAANTGKPARHGAVASEPNGPNGINGPNGKNRRPSPEEVLHWRNQILEQLAVRPLQLNGGDEPLVIALVGPTGVGKTTTAAKIAAWFSLHENARVALLSMDCYRIGATDQLRTYARIMQLPCEIALRRQDLNAALEKHRHKDLIIIDTAGKSPFDEGHIPELGRWFADHGAIIPYLVLSATAKKEDLNHIIAAYRPLGVSAAILTKLDETRAYAALCQQMARAELPIACLCTGQKVPEDFLPADKDFLKALFGDGWNAAMRQQEATVAADGWLSS